MVRHARQAKHRADAKGKPGQGKPGPPSVQPIHNPQTSAQAPLQNTTMRQAFMT